MSTYDTYMIRVVQTFSDGSFSEFHYVGDRDEIAQWLTRLLPITARDIGAEMTMKITFHRAPVSAGANS